MELQTSRIFDVIPAPMDLNFESVEYPLSVVQKTRQTTQTQPGVFVYGTARYMERKGVNGEGGSAEFLSKALVGVGVISSPTRNKYSFWLRGWISGD